MTLERDDLTHHFSRQFNQEMEDLRTRVLAMGGLVEQQTADAITALISGDINLASTVVQRDVQVNAMEVAVDEDCSRILARRQPAAGDLRMIIAVIKTVTDLERIGDQAERVARMAIALAEADPPHDQFPIHHLGDQARRMLNRALDAYARLDIELALEVSRGDRDVDREYEAILRQLITFMMEDPRAIRWALSMVWAARALERIGDHAKNLCEYLIYMVKGKDVRHISLEDMEARVHQP